MVKFGIPYFPYFLLLVTSRHMFRSIIAYDQPQSEYQKYYYVQLLVILCIEDALLSIILSRSREDVVIDTTRYVVTFSISKTLFFVDFFTILILVDVFILLISFQYTERYSQLIRNTGFIISTILLRLSFSATGLVSIILLVSGIIFGIIILAIYNQMEKQSIKV